ncbi:MAG: vWA domain-containing protein [Bryobacteraceae bacterium]
MFLLNLSLPQLLSLFGGASAIVVALYLFDRSRRKQVVATLRFWIAAEQPLAVSHRKHIHQPLSLILQLLSIALLLLAIAQLRIGSPGSAPPDHILLLETSAWMNARLPRTANSRQVRTLMDEARSRASSYVRALPAGHRVMVVRADALATPVTGFEASRQKIEEAIAASRPGSTALNLERGMEFARQTQALSARRAGEVVFVGSGRISEQESEAASAAGAPNLRVLPVADAIENCGLRRIGLRQSPHNPGLWEILVSARNYGARARPITMHLRFGDAPVGARQLSLPPAAEQEAVFTLNTRAAGLLEVRLVTRDDFPDDDRVVLELPQQKSLPVVVYSNEPETLRPALEADPRVTAVFKRPGEYKPDGATLIVLDRFRPQPPPTVDSIWIDPPAEGSPIPVAKNVTGAKIVQWNAAHPLGSGLRTKDLTLASTSVFRPAPGELTIAESDAGPVVVARNTKPKIVVMGFHPARSAMRYELAAPLLFANSLRWMAPDVFRRLDLTAGSVGTVSLTLDPDVQASEVRVLHEDGRPLPYSLRGQSMRFFSGESGLVRVIAADREMVYSLTLPELGPAKWTPPAGAEKGIPAFRDRGAASSDIWQVLAALGAIGLIAEWLIYGRFWRTRRVSGSLRTPRFRILSGASKGVR